MAIIGHLPEGMLVCYKEITSALVVEYPICDPRPGWFKSFPESNVKIYVEIVLSQSLRINTGLYYLNHQGRCP
jgi:hypothetical protein